MKHPTKHSPIYKHKPHLAFIRKLPCCKCNTAPSQAFSFEGNAEYSLPICEKCLADKLAGYIRLKDDTEARELARKLWLYSGDAYTCIMTMINKEVWEV